MSAQARVRESSAGVVTSFNSFLSLVAMVCRRWLAPTATVRLALASHEASEAGSHGARCSGCRIPPINQGIKALAPRQQLRPRQHVRVLLEQGLTTVLGHPAPHSVLDLVVQCVGCTLTQHRAPIAYFRRSTLTGFADEQRVGMSVATQPFRFPALSVGIGAARSRKNVGVRWLPRSRLSCHCSSFPCCQRRSPHACILSTDVDTRRDVKDAAVSAKSCSGKRA